MSKFFILPGHSKLPFVLFSISLIILSILGVMLCYYTGQDAIYLEPMNWNMKAISIVY
jgi:hypothetical protein